MEIVWFFLLLLVWHATPSQSHGTGDCTNGMLFVSDTNSSTLHVYNVSQRLDQPLSEIHTITNLKGGAGQAVEATANGLHVISTYWGSEEADYQDGFVNFINTGVTAEDHGNHAHLDYAEISVLENVFLACGPVWHAAHHAEYLSLYCDGSFDNGVNTTIYVLQEGSLSDDPKNPFVYNGTIPGSHHGIAIPVDANHILHSLPTTDRLNRVNGSDSLPDAFQVLNYKDGTVVLSLNDTGSAESHCKAFHGSTAVKNTFYMCCEDKVLVVQYDSAGGSFTTRALEFPDAISSVHRCGSNHATAKSDYVVTNYADWNADVYAPHLMAFPNNATEIVDADVLVFGDVGQCEYAFEQSVADHLIVLLPNGTLQAYSYGRPDGWKLGGEVDIDGISTCDDATMAVGYGQAFVAVSAARTIFSIDLTHLGHDHDLGDGADHSLTAVPTQVSYAPAHMTVSGVPHGTACVSEASEVEGGGSGTGPTSAAPDARSWRTATRALALALGIGMASTLQC